MKPRSFDPLRLDVEAFAREAGQLSGQWPLASLGRLAGSLVNVSAGEVVRWEVEGEAKTSRGGAQEACLGLQVQASLNLECQRCLEPVAEQVTLRRRFHFVPDESTAEALDAETDDDVLVLTHSLDLRALVEDELLLALPLVPRHDQCPRPLSPAAESELPGEVAQENPFGVLASLRKRPGGG
jgi:uncharacterized protein